MSRVRPFLLIAVVLALLAAACSSSGKAAAPSTTTAPATTSTTATPATTTTEAPVVYPAPPSPDPLAWRPCDEGFECATLTVPLDYLDPTGVQIDVAVIRLTTADPRSRLGSLIVNPGGPGASGLDYLRQSAFAFPVDISSRFDLVSFDPRGVGASTAVDCVDDFDDQIPIVEAGDDAAWDLLFDEAQAFADACETRSGPLLPFVGTNNTARDLDQLRIALGDEQLTYLGFSYGTQIGAVYADLFPGRVRALVLDAAVAPTTDIRVGFEGQTEGFEIAFANFVDGCASDPDCPLNELGPPEEVFRQVEAGVRFLNGLEVDDPNRRLTPGEFYYGVLSAMYSTASWQPLAAGLYLADTQVDGEVLQQFTDSIYDRRPDGSYGNLFEAISAINCADTPERLDREETATLATEVAAESPHFAPLTRATTICFGWPEASDPVEFGPATGAPPILVIGTTGDPATPYKWAVDMADMLDRGALFTVVGDGHTAFLRIPCVSPVVSAYLIDLFVPDEGATCDGTLDRDLF